MWRASRLDQASEVLGFLASAGMMLVLIMAAAFSLTIACMLGWRIVGFVFDLLFGVQVPS